MARGIEGRDIFRDTKDREAFLWRLSEVVAESSVQLLAIETARLERKERIRKPLKPTYVPRCRAAFMGCFSLRLKKNIDWDLFKRWKVTRNPSVTEDMASVSLHREPLRLHHHGAAIGEPVSCSKT